MMNRFLLISISCLWLSLGFAQPQRYFDQLDRTERLPASERCASENEMEVIDFDRENYAELLFFEINRFRKRKRLKPFIQDSVFNQVCNTCVKHLPRSLLMRNGAPERKTIRYIDLGIRHLEGENRVFTAYSFYTNLTDLRRMTTYYYDRRGPDGEMNLYLGTRPTGSDKKGKKAQLRPVEAITEKEWTRRIMKTLYRRAKSFGIRSRDYTHVGISVRLNEYTVERKAIPHAYVMIIVGGKQTFDIREPRQTTVTRPVLDSTLYLLMK